ncbi:hypothetical protein J4Q44_G00364620 [Coregonus suidteri]|uniref:Uncharacterized protein n=1 Tax=Coregonus suidteri TaxID=861788 RepID=A0AAN8KUQ5_9TELE
MRFVLALSKISDKDIFWLTITARPDGTTYYTIFGRTTVLQLHSNLLNNQRAKRIALWETCPHVDIGDTAPAISRTKL